MGFKEWFKQHTYYCRRGTKIGLIIGFIDFILLTIASTMGSRFMMNLNYIPCHFILDAVEHATTRFGEGSILILWLINLPVLMIFYLIVGGIVGLIIDKFKFGKEGIGSKGLRYGILPKNRVDNVINILLIGVLAIIAIMWVFISLPTFVGVMVVVGIIYLIIHAHSKERG